MMLGESSPMRPFLLALVLSLFVCPAFASAPYLVTDLKTTPDSLNSSEAVYLGKLDGVVFFGARIDSEQYALWRTDGTPGGTFELLKLRRDPLFGFPYAGLVTGGGFAYFGAYDAEGWKLWKSNGTVAGTTAVTPATRNALAPIAMLPQGRIPILLSTTAGRELWVYDSSGFRSLALTIRSTQYLTTASMGGNVYLASDSGIWKSDGTESGTSRMASMAAFNLTAANDRLFFAGATADTGFELWLTDGTFAGTHLVTDLRSGTASTFAIGTSVITPFGNGVAFTGTNGEVGVSDGTPAGTRILRTGVKPNAFAPNAMSVLNGVVFFAFDDGVHGRELWRSDGTDAGTRMIRDHNRNRADITSIVAGATRVYYYDIADAAGLSLELFESDGTEAGTHAVHRTTGTKWRGSAGSFRTLITVGDTVLFNTDDGEHGSEPWVSDGSDAGTHLLANVAGEGPGSSVPDNLIAGSDRLYFLARDNDSPTGVWSTDGTAAGTQRVMNGTGVLLATNGNTLYLKRGGTTVLPQLWKSEGGLPGTEVLVKDFNQGFNIPGVYGVYVFGGRVYVIANDGRNTQLWTTDGTTAGTKPLTQFFIDGPTAPVSIGSQTYFITGRESILFATDGTPEGTRSVAHTNNTTGPWAPLIPFGGSLLAFVEVQSADESQLVRFSGTAGDAEIIKHFPGGSYIKRPQAASIGSSILFSWQNGPQHPNQLWKSDGTTDGTQMIRDFGVPGPPTLEALVSLGTRVVFIVDDGVHGREPWVSDGTAEGTKLLRDINPGSELGTYGQFFVADGIAYFSAVDAEHGWELWQTDGTPEGTQLVADIEPGSNSSSPGSFARVGNTLYFRASTVATGSELWAYPLPFASAITIDDARVRENASTATLTLRLTQPASQRVTVEFETADDTAKSGRDYTAKSGSVVFERGESVKSISVSIANDATPGMVRSFFVRLRNAGIPIERAAGAVVIEDDDVVADVAVSLAPTDYLPIITVTNNGPSAASNVRLCTAAPPEWLSFTCGTPFELAAGRDTDPTDQRHERIGSRESLFVGNGRQSGEQHEHLAGLRLGIELAGRRACDSARGRNGIDRGGAIQIQRADRRATDVVRSDRRRRSGHGDDCRRHGERNDDLQRAQTRHGDDLREDAPRHPNRDRARRRCRRGAARDSLPADQWIHGADIRQSKRPPRLRERPHVRRRAADRHCAVLRRRTVARQRSASKAIRGAHDHRSAIRNSLLQRALQRGRELLRRGGGSARSLHPPRRGLDRRRRHSGNGERDDQRARRDGLRSDRHHHRHRERRATVCYGSAREDQ